MFSRLISEKDEIRLLSLRDSKSLTEYSLKNVPLETAPTFYALSYAWEDQSLFSKAETSQDCYVQVNGSQVRIRSNLAAALDAWRGHTFGHIPLWVDSLCIDQNNIPERNEQVLRIYSIYKKATVVAVWLGPEAHDSSLAFDFMNTFSHEAQDPEWVRRTIKERIFSREWAAVDHLLRRSWWRRVWIIQEMAAAKEIVFVCGHQIVKSDVVLRFFELLIYLHGTYRDLLVREEGIELYGDSITLGNTYLRPHGWEKRNLLQTIYITGKSLASDPRDKIYAVLGLALDATQIVGSPNYSHTIEEVYKNFAVSFVQKYRSLEFLSLAGLSVFPRRKDLSLPSWTPDWNHRNATTLNSTIRPAVTTIAAKEYPARVEFSANFENLIAQGICVDTIDGMGYSVWGAETDMDGFELQQTRSREARYHSGSDALEAISRTLVSNSHKTGNVRSLFVQKCKESIAMTVQDKGSLSISSTLFKEWYVYNQDFIISGKSLREWVESFEDVGASDIEETAKESYSNKLAITHGRTRRLITTMRGYIGMGINSCSPGDLVCILFGCSTPVVLRQYKEQYIFIGEAYLHGVMNGEAIDGLQRGEFIKRHFSIC